MSTQSKVIKKTILTGLFAALSIVIGIVCRSYLTFGAIRISFDNIPVFIAGLGLGPFYATLVAVIADVISGFISSGTINPIITLGAMVIGLFGGLLPMLIGRLKPFAKTLITVTVSHILGSMIIKSIGLYVFYGFGMPILIWRIPLYLGISVAESMIVYIIMKNKAINKLFSDIK